MSGSPDGGKTCRVGPPRVVQMLPEDSTFAARLVRSRTDRYGAMSPAIWRAAEGAEEVQRAELAQMVTRGDVMALRTGSGFAVAQLRGNDCFLDDFAVSDPGLWESDGTALLLDCWEGVHAMGATGARVASAGADPAKSAMLRSLGLVVGEQWWAKPVAPQTPAAAGGQLQGPGFRALVGPAPPGYDPGGPVAFVRYLGPSGDLSEVESRAAQAGAALVVVPERPGGDREGELESRGYEVAVQWYLGTPSRPVPGLARGEGEARRPEGVSP